ncbi:MAG TPA: TadE/TadG family type IV pilus assembly protein [Terriglobales bacterium]
MNRLARDTQAAEIAELAVVLPILFTMIFAIFSFGRAYNVYSTVTRGAEEGARVAVTPVCASCSPIICSGVNGQFPCDAAVAQAVTDVLAASHLDPGQMSARVPANSAQGGCLPPAAAAPTCTVASNVEICRDVLLNTASNPPACGTVVSFSYHYQFLPIPFSTVQSIDIPATAQLRVEY